MAEFPQGFFRSPRFAIPQNSMTGVSVEEERGGREGGILVRHQVDQLDPVWPSISHPQMSGK